MVRHPKGVSALLAVPQKDAPAYATKAALDLSKRQGIFRSNPTWREIWKAEPRLKMYFVVIQTVIVAPLVYLIYAYLPPSWLSVVLIFLGSFIGGAVTERLLRLWVVRRAVTAARPDDEAPVSARLKPPADGS